MGVQEYFQSLKEMLLLLITLATGELLGVNVLVITLIADRVCKD